MRAPSTDSNPPPAGPRRASRIPSRLGDFAITGPLGEGGSGAVYAAYRGDEAVALKVLRPDLALSPKEVSAFLREAERMRRVQHPSLIPLIDAGVLPDGRPYVAMPQLDGETLGESLEMGPFELPEAIRLFEGLAGAVGALHEAGLVHRDIKPENIFVEGDSERLILLDLGIARELGAPSSTTTQAGLVRGTPAYMAPERFFGAQASVRSDLYELAVVLYMMLTAKLPWDDASDASARMAPKRPSERGVELPAGLVAALFDALSPNPSLRPETAAAFFERVRRAAAGEAEEPAAETRRLGPATAVNKAANASATTRRLRRTKANATHTAALAPTERVIRAEDEPAASSNACACADDPKDESACAPEPVASKDEEKPASHDTDERADATGERALTTSARSASARSLLPPEMAAPDATDAASTSPRAPHRLGFIAIGMAITALAAGVALWGMGPSLGFGGGPRAQAQTGQETAQLPAMLPRPPEHAAMPPGDEGNALATSTKDMVEQHRAEMEEAQKVAEAMKSKMPSAVPPWPPAVAIVAGASAAAAAPGPQGDMPECQKLVAFYCSPAFKRTDNGMTCAAWQGNLAGWRALPQVAKASLEGGCRSSYAAAPGVLKTREQLMKAGTAPAP